MIFGGQQLDTHVLKLSDSVNSEEPVKYLEHNKFENFSKENFVFNDMTFRIHKIPSKLLNKVRKKDRKSYSENLLGFIGESTIVVIDLDNKKTVF